MIAGDGYDSSGAYRGIAPYSDILSLRVLDSQGQGVVSDALAALDWLLRNASTYNIRVANLSLGKAIEEPAADDPLVQAVEAVWDAGITVVCSAGNYGRDGYFTITSPGNSSKVITVGSVTDSKTGNNPNDDYVSSYSSKGPTLFDHFAKPDLIAPGNRFVAPVSYEARMKVDLADRLVDCGTTSCSGSHIELSRTSMAAAMVSGAAALMLEADPSLTPDTIKARLMRSARKPAGGDPFTTGAGVLNINAALSEGGSVAHAPSPKSFFDSQTGRMGFQNMAVLWSDSQFSQAVLWTDAVLWSDAVLWTDAVLWSDAVLWTDAVLWSDAVLWTDAVLWSDAVPWSDAVVNANPLFRTSSQGLEFNDD